MKKRAVSLLVCLALLSSLLTASAAATFKDVEGHWASTYIVKAANYGLFQGYGNGFFGVEDHLDRASFTTLLCRILSWKSVTPQTPSYIDCKPGEWYYSDVETALAHGALERTSTFRPEDPITREEMAIMLVRALGYEQLAKAGYHFDLPFSDVTENLGYIALAWQFGFIEGSESGSGLVFLPHDYATRAEAATMVVRFYERYISGIDWLHGFYAISSYSQIGMTDSMDAVSVGWARLEQKEDGTPWVNTTSANGNGWVIPAQSEYATSHFQANGTPYNLNIFCDVSAILTDEGTRNSAAAAVAAMAKDYDGITIDFEMLRAANKNNFTAFMTTLRQVLPADKSLYVCVSPVVPNDSYFDGYNYRALGDLCDKVILMAHDYQFTSVPESYLGTTHTNSYLTPFNKIYYALAAITDPSTGVADRSKIALAISIASTGWHVDEDGRLLEQTRIAPSPSIVITRLRQSDTRMGWSDIARNAYIDYTADGEHYRLWYEDARSVMEKVDLARMFGITGVSLWRLGNVPNYTDEGLYYDVWGNLLMER